MALVTRWFSTVAAGAGDGTSWANRAALFSGGSWSSVMTGFAFNGSDSLEARIGPGTYSMNQTLSPALFSNAPTLLNNLIVRACNSSGSYWIHPNPAWTSTIPTWDTSGMPVIVCGAGATVALANGALWAKFYGISFKPGPSGIFTSLLGSSGTPEFISCYLLIDVNGGSSGNVGGRVMAMRNCSILVTSNIGSASGIDGGLFNTRCETTNTANTGPGMEVQSNIISKCTSVGWKIPFRQGNSGTGQALVLLNSTGVARGLSDDVGITHATAGAVTNQSKAVDSLIAEAGVGMSTTGVANFFLSNCAFNNVTTPVNYSTNQLLDFITTNEVLTDLFVDPAGGDYRIKKTSSLWGKGIGAGDELSSGSLILPSNFAWVA